MWVNFLIICYSVHLICGFHIDLMEKDVLIHDNQKITKENLYNLLHDHEKILLFGNLTVVPKFYMATVRHHKRRRRSLNRYIKVVINGEEVNLKFDKPKPLLDNNFILINRYANSSVHLKAASSDSINIKEFNDCFYRNNYAAIDVCEEGNMRGILKYNRNKFQIHPLPERLGGKSHHLIIESKNMIVSPDDRDYRTSINLRSPKPTVIDSHLYSKIGGKEVRNNSQLDVYNNTKKITNIQRIINETSNKRYRRYISSTNKIPSVLHIETAIFVDKDLFGHMAKNYPQDTETNLIRFVLAMINGVQLLYQHPSLGHQINFVLKRLEILHSDPKDLRRSSDIDIFLNSFCLWQRKFNPPSDADSMHFDHAVILTGLDLYVVAKSGKISSQVVGLAPVAGMCTTTSSCTINEGKHFESVFVVAHEIGHNLGMRHDTPDNGCDPSLFIMSPTLGSGKITWSKCSRNYLNAFLNKHQARCLFDRGHFGANLDHLAEDIMPGERFDANQQCLLKYGRGSVRSKLQPIAEICRDLHCERDRYTWTSHPALDGTYCGDGKWCQSGMCVHKNNQTRNDLILSFNNQISSITHNTINTEISKFSDDRKTDNLKEDPTYNQISMWGNWSEPSECESGCLYGDSGRLREGSTGLRTYTRTCLDYRWNRKKCLGSDKKYESCSSNQCLNISRTTILEFSNQICERATKFDNSIFGVGIQIVGKTPEESCKVFCKSKSGVPSSKNWLYPDGTTCRNLDTDIDDTFHCVNGRCEKFNCENSELNLFRANSDFCPQNLVMDDVKSEKIVNELKENTTGNKVGDKSLNITMTEKTMEIWKYQTTAQPILPTPVPQIYNPDNDQVTTDRWHVRGYDEINTLSNESTSQLSVISDSYHFRDKWITRSGCHFSCIELSQGIQIIESDSNVSVMNIQLCKPEVIACDRLETTYEYSNRLCSKFQSKVRGLSGNGMQIAPSIEDPDRSCRVACQDDYLPHRFYLVNGDMGYFPFGTKCSRIDNRYCINGQCLEFGPDNIPLSESHISLAMYRSKRATVMEKLKNHRKKRSFLYYEPVNITERLGPNFFDNVIRNFKFPEINYDYIDVESLDLSNPIHIPTEEMENLYR